MTTEPTGPGRKRYIVILAAALLAVWLLNDIILDKALPFEKGEEYSFEDKLAEEVKDKVNGELQRFETSPDPKQQLYALVHALECNYFLVYNSYRRLERYYDFIKILLFPLQRRQLKNKENYLRQVRRYLKRKRNVDIYFSKYEISAPRFSGPAGGETAQLTVIRTIVTGLERGRTPGADIAKEVLTYNFRRHSDRWFYLYFPGTSFFTGTSGSPAPKETQ